MIRGNDERRVSHSGSICSEHFASAGQRYSCSSRKTSTVSRKEPNKTSPQCNQVALTQNHHNSSERRRFNKSFHYYRFVVIMFGGASVGAMFLLRYNITVAILNMVNQTALYMEEHPGKTMDDFLAEGLSPGGEFHWNNEVQQMIMSSYMLTYTLPQFPMTKVGTMLGSQWMVPLSLGLCIISSVLTPSFAYIGYEWIVALRFINGFGGTAILPMMIGLIESWMPYDQLSLGLTFSQITFSIINAVTPLLAGYFTAIHWSWAFYGPSAIAAVLCALWLIMITSTPENNWLISQKELDRIHGVDDSVPNLEDSKTNEKPQVEEEHEQLPWYVVFKERSLYCYLLMFTMNCTAYASFTFILPVYLRQFYKISISDNGAYCGLIQSGAILAVLWPHPILSLLQSNLKLTETLARRTIHVFITIIVIGTYLFVGFFHEWQLMIFFLNRVLYCSNDVIVTGNLMGNYAKAGLSCLTFSIANTVGNLTVIPISVLIGWLLDRSGQSEEAWCWIFSALALAQLLFCLIFITTVKAGPIDFGQEKKHVEDLGKQLSSRGLADLQLDAADCNNKNERAIM